MTYELHMRFDAGSGYAVDHDQLSLTENTRRWLTYLIAWFDTSLDWSAPPATAGHWDKAELQRFLSAKAAGLVLLLRELSTEFDVSS